MQAKYRMVLQNMLAIFHWFPTLLLFNRQKKYEEYEMYINISKTIPMHCPSGENILLLELIDLH